MVRNARRVLIGAVVPAGAITLWALWSSQANNYYFPPLGAISDSFQKTWLFTHAASDALPSLVRLMLGFAISVVVGVGAGLAMGISRNAHRAAEPIVEFLRGIPAPALLPFAILVFGVGDAMKVLIIALACVWPVLLNTIDGVTGLDPTLNDTAHAYKIGRFDRIWNVVLPAASPRIFAGMRTSLALALLMMVISEMVASSNGIGYLVLNFQRSFAIPEMWSGIVLLGLLGVGLNSGLVVIESRVIRWHHGAQQSALSQ